MPGLATLSLLLRLAAWEVPRAPLDGGPGDARNLIRHIVPLSLVLGVRVAVLSTRVVERQGTPAVSVCCFGGAWLRRQAS
jgi:hypothetical protein